jgi:hypothetical protein
VNDRTDGTNLKHVTAQLEQIHCTAQFEMLTSAYFIARPSGIRISLTPLPSFYQTLYSGCNRPVALSAP